LDCCNKLPLIWWFKITKTFFHSSGDPKSKIKELAGGTHVAAQVVECLTSKHLALSSNPNNFTTTPHPQTKNTFPSKMLTGSALIGESWRLRVGAGRILPMSLCCILMPVVCRQSLAFLDWRLHSSTHCLWHHRLSLCVSSFYVSYEDTHHWILGLP
jgi:hypothetical protein